MGDEIAHVGVVDGALRLGFPGVIGGLIIGEDSDDVEIVDIAECGARGVHKFAAEDKVKSLHGRAFGWVGLDHRVLQSAWRVKRGRIGR